MPRAKLLVVIAVGSAALGTACKRSPSEGEPSPSTTASPSATESASEPGPSSVGSAGAGRHEPRDAEPAIDTARLLDGGADRACQGTEIDLAAAVVDSRCAIGSAQAKSLLAALEQRDAGAASLRQEGKLLPDGAVVVRLVNRGSAPIALPLSWHPKLPAFSAIAEDDQHALFELEPPKLEPPNAGAPRAHFARIVLAPGGAAFARVAIPTTVVKRIAPACDAGTCAPPKLPRGRYVLHIGELVVDLEAGPPARIEWQVP